MHRATAVLAALLLCGCIARPDGSSRGWHLVPGTFEPDRGPDGNSIFLDAADGLILIDTGRHPEHRDRILAHAAERGLRIAAVVNTHWHLDHTAGNREIRSAFPNAPLYATTAVEGALARFFPQSRAAAQRFLESGRAAPAQRAEIARDLSAIDDPSSLRASRPVTASGPVRIAGRRLMLNVARFAATEADLWIHDAAARLVIAGDLVVAPVPFMDTACAEGWQRALDEIAALDFDTLIPGHGAPMTRPQFLAWRTAFNNLLDCARSTAERASCIAGWQRDAALFIAPADRSRIARMTGYYLDTRLRSSPEEQGRWCGP